MTGAARQVLAGAVLKKSDEEDGGAGDAARRSSVHLPAAPVGNGAAGDAADHAADGEDRDRYRPDEVSPLLRYPLARPISVDVRYKFFQNL